MKRWLLLVSLITGCGKVSSKTPDAAMGSGSDAKPIDSKSIDAPAICSPTGTFDAPVPLAGYATSAAEGTTRFSPDELTMYISGDLLGDTESNIYVATRSAVAGNFGTATKLANINSTANDWDMTVSADGLTMVFGTLRNTNMGTDLYIATRSSTLADFGTPSAASINSNVDMNTNDDAQPFLTVDGQELWWSSNRAGGAGGHDFYFSTITGGSFGTPTRVAELSSAGDDWMPVLSADKLTIYFGTNTSAAGTKGIIDIWTSHRTSTSATWPPPTPVPELNSSGFDVPAYLSSDNCRLYFWSTVSGNSDVYVAVRHP